MTDIKDYGICDLCGKGLGKRHYCYSIQITDDTVKKEKSYGGTLEVTTTTTVSEHQQTIIRYICSRCKKKEEFLFWLGIIMLSLAFVSIMGGIFLWDAEVFGVFFDDYVLKPKHAIISASLGLIGAILLSTSQIYKKIIKELGIKEGYAGNDLYIRATCSVDKIIEETEII